MKFGFKQNILAAACVLFLVACGGGGGDEGSGSSTGTGGGISPTPPQKYSQTDVAHTAGADIALHQIAGSRTAFLPGFFGGLVQSLASDTGGSRVLPLSCTSGTASLQLTKVAPHTGLAVGDELKFSFNKCASPQAVVDGAATLAIQGPVSPSITGDFNINLDATMTQFSVTRASVVDLYNGRVSILAASAEFVSMRPAKPS